MAFLASVADDGANEALPVNLANEIFLYIVPGLAERFSFGYHQSWDYSKKETQQIDHFLAFFDRSYQLGLLSELNVIVSGLTSESMGNGDINITRFNTYLLPMLKRLAAWLLGTMVPAQGSPVQALFQGLLPVYIKRFVKKEPRPPTDWTRPKSPAYCYCRDHAAFNEFLQDPNREIGRFIMSIRRQNHIQAAVDKTEFYTDIDRSERNRALIVIKNHQRHFVADHEAWQKRKDTAAANIKDLASEAELRALLGDLYDSVTTATITEESEVVGITQVDQSRPLENEVGSSRSFGKRKGAKRRYVESDDEDDA